MQPWLATLAAPLAATAVRSAGQVAAAAAEPFAAALDRALGGAESCEDCPQDETVSLRERIQQRLSKLLAPFAGDGQTLAFQVNPDTGDVAVEGDSPAADAVRHALNDDRQLRAGIAQLAANSANGGASQGNDSAWPSFFTDGVDNAVALVWNGRQLNAA
ncbi:MAG: hypothetical protein KDA44_20000 [Planctomycetales bacterium]|nr:hypothetical protein [Planctomycetales bacterium]